MFKAAIFAYFKAFIIIQLGGVYVQMISEGSVTLNEINRLVGSFNLLHPLFSVLGQVLYLFRSGYKNSLNQDVEVWDGNKTKASFFQIFLSFMVGLIVGLFHDGSDGEVPILGSNGLYIVDTLIGYFIIRIVSDESENSLWEWFKNLIKKVVK